MKQLTDEQRLNLEMLGWILKKNWYLIPYMIIMVWGIIATLMGY